MSINNAQFLHWTLSKAIFFVWLRALVLSMVIALYTGKYTYKIDIFSVLTISLWVHFDYCLNWPIVAIIRIDVALIPFSDLNLALSELRLCKILFDSLWFHFPHRHTPVYKGTILVTEKHRADFNFFGHFLPRLSRNDLSQVISKASFCWGHSI